MEIRPFTAEDYPQVSEIYLQGIATRNATFETAAPTWESWDKAHLPDIRLAAFEGDMMMGWIALLPVSSRCVYQGVAEESIYIREEARGTGVGRKLLMLAIAESEKAGYWTLQAGMFPENGASIRLHESCGFRQIGYRERIGCMDGQWRDTISMERRSKAVGL